MSNSIKGIHHRPSMLKDDLWNALHEETFIRTQGLASRVGCSQATAAFYLRHWERMNVVERRKYSGCNYTEWRKLGGNGDGEYNGDFLRPAAMRAAGD